MERVNGESKTEIFNRKRRSALHYKRSKKDVTWIKADYSFSQGILFCLSSQHSPRAVHIQASLCGFKINECAFPAETFFVWIVLTYTLLFLSSRREMFPTVYRPRRPVFE